MSEKRQQMAIMRHVRFGVNDRGSVSLSFESYLTESSAAGQYIPFKESEAFIKAYGVSDVRMLEGKPVWVDADNMTMTNPQPCVMR